jgi:hypothetical protein
MFTRLATPALIALVVLGWECGGAAGSDTGSASSLRPTANADAKPTVDVCSLLTVEEIAAVTGAKVAEMKDTTYGSVGNCNYTVAGETFPIVSLLLAPRGPDVANSAAMAEWQRKNAKNGMSFGKELKFIVEPIEGLGVPAIRTEVEGMGLVTVQAVAKGKLLEVTTSSLDRSKPLATKAIARIP